MESTHYSSCDTLYQGLVTWIMRAGKKVTARGMETRERTGVYFILTNPRARLLSFEVRKWSLPLALGELCWHLRGDDNLSPLAYYAKRWARYSDDGVHIRGSCYGKKIFGIDDSGLVGWQRVVELLQSDPNSRRAVLDLTSEDIDLITSRDVSCVNSIQFVIRDGCVDLFVFMRSNDLFLGLPYDIFLFTMLQEMMALTLGRPIGHYHHMATSLHIYESDFGRASQSMRAAHNRPTVMPPMLSVQGIKNFVVAEARIRAGLSYDADTLDQYWAPLADSLVAFSRNKTHGYPFIMAS